MSLKLLSAITGLLLCGGVWSLGQDSLKRSSTADVGEERNWVSSRRDKEGGRMVGITNEDAFAARSIDARRNGEIATTNNPGERFFSPARIERGKREIEGFRLNGGDGERRQTNLEEKFSQRDPFLVDGMVVATKKDSFGPRFDQRPATTKGKPSEKSKLKRMVDGEFVATKNSSDEGRTSPVGVIPALGAPSKIGRETRPKKSMDAVLFGTAGSGSFVETKVESPPRRNDDHNRKAKEKGTNSDLREIRSEHSTAFFGGEEAGIRQRLRWPPIKREPNNGGGLSGPLFPDSKGDVKNSGRRLQEQRSISSTVRFRPPKQTKPAAPLYFDGYRFHPGQDPSELFSSSSGTRSAYPSAAYYERRPLFSNGTSALKESKNVCGGRECHRQPSSAPASSSLEASSVGSNRTIVTGVGRPATFQMTSAQFRGNREGLPIGPAGGPGAPYSAFQRDKGETFPWPKYDRFPNHGQAIILNSNYEGQRFPDKPPETQRFSDIPMSISGSPESAAASSTSIGETASLSPSRQEQYTPLPYTPKSGYGGIGGAGSYGGSLGGQSGYNGMPYNIYGSSNPYNGYGYNWNNIYGYNNLNGVNYNQFGYGNYPKKIKAEFHGWVYPGGGSKYPYTPYPFGSSTYGSYPYGTYPSWGGGGNSYWGNYYNRGYYPHGHGHGQGQGRGKGFKSSFKRIILYPFYKKWQLLSSVLTGFGTYGSKYNKQGSYIPCSKCSWGGGGRHGHWGGGGGYPSTWGGGGYPSTWGGGGYPSTWGGGGYPSSWGGGYYPSSWGGKGGSWGGKGGSWGGGGYPSSSGGGGYPSSWGGKGASWGGGGYPSSWGGKPSSWGGSWKNPNGYNQNTYYVSGKVKINPNNKSWNGGKSGYDPYGAGRK